MRRPRNDQNVATVARAWGRMRLLVLAVKEARNSCRCEYETWGDGGFDPGVAPCWKSLEWDHRDGPRNPDEWCAPCLERQRWYAALVAIKRMHGGRLRRLQRFSAAPELMMR